MGSPLRLSLLPVAMFTTVALVLTLARGGDTQAPDKAGTEGKIKELLKQRVAVLTEAYDLSVTGYKGGGVPRGRVLEAQAILLAAKLELCETKEERVKLHEEMVKVAEEQLGHIEKQHQAHEATKIDVLKTKAQVLQTQIGLERARAAK